MAIGLIGDTLVFDFAEVHPDAVLRVTFQRTLRVPDDGRDHHLPPGLGSFPLRAVDDLPKEQVPAAWGRRGGVAMPMWQAEACWLSFGSLTGYPMAVKVAAGKVNAVNGRPWSDDLDFEDQDYVEVPSQPWLDGFCVTKGTVRQFVAMPLGEGYTAEEQITGAAQWGGVQLLVRPLRRNLWEKRLEERRRFQVACRVAYSASPTGMGFAPGGSIRQHINRAVERPEDWDPAARSRCFMHMVNASAWPALTGGVLKGHPPTAADYTRAGLPWFAWYDEQPALEGSTLLARLTSVYSVGLKRDEQPLPENADVEPPEPVVLRPQFG
jgi:hypothetical protein